MPPPRIQARHNQVERLDRKVIERLARHLAARGTGGESYALNVSVRSVQNRDFLMWIESLLRSHRAIAPHLVSEMAELGVVRDMDTAQRFAELLRAAIEDIGVLPLLQSLGIDAYRGYASGKPVRIT
jgi:EAL domain-containing protein (putative c-di-GMP-specific phosphodiesterase class I)